MKKPNFFIVGAPKCGTTALSDYLRTHPNVFMSSPKEPHYFAEDMAAYRYCNSEADYLKLFEEAKNTHIAIGEASVLYLYSEFALKEIYKFDPSAKIIVMLRKQVEYLPSFHSQLLLNSDEVVYDFQKAWRLQDSRKRGENVSKKSRIPKLLYYKEVGSLGAQVENLLDIFPREQVHFIFMDDFKKDVRKEYLNVLNFLDLKDDGKNEFPVINKNKVYKSTSLRQFGKSNFVKFMRSNLKKLNVNYYPLISKINSINKVEKQREPLLTNFKEELIKTFETDVELLEKLSNKNLKHWKQ